MRNEMKKSMKRGKPAVHWKKSEVRKIEHGPSNLREKSVEKQKSKGWREVAQRRRARRDPERVELSGAE